MTSFDYILTGGGMAGLSLAYQMANSPLKDRQILIVDREPKTTNDRTWCFWAREKSPFEEILDKDWGQLQFSSPTFSKTYNLAPYRYHMLRGIDFYRHTQGVLRQLPNVHFLYGDVSEVKGSGDCASVTVDGREYRADWVFDSLFLPGDFKPDPDRYHALWQHFKGWVIETEHPIFNPDLPTMFDFRTPQDGAMRFMYILPSSEHRALVEYTLFSPTLLTDDAYDRALKHYITNILGLAVYEITEVEQGKIPMTDQPFPRFPEPRHMTIGTKGGRVKPTTGYAFHRTQKDSQAIVKALLEYNDPTRIPSDKQVFKLYDSIMLEVMENNGGRMTEIFTALFKNNPIQKVFRFLDENSSFMENLSIIASIPPGPLIKALFKTSLQPGK